MPPLLTGLAVDLLGFLTGTALYVMLVALVWRERASEGAPFLSRRGRLPLLTGVCGIVWNVGMLVSFVLGLPGHGGPPPLLAAVTFSGLGFLPAVVVHAVLEGRETDAGRHVIRTAIVAAYVLSATAAILHVAAALRGRPVPSHAALWLLTGGFVGLAVLLLVVTREQPIGRRGVWIVALAVFAVGALHFERHTGDEAWWVDLIGHHASLPLALAILHQDYRFALADLFLKNAIALLLLMAVAMACLSGVILPMWRIDGPGFATDPRAIAVIAVLWMATAVMFPWLKRLAARLVDRTVLRRPDYDAVLAGLGGALEADETADDVLARVRTLVRAALGGGEGVVIEDPLPESDPRLVVAGVELRRLVEAPAALLVRVHTVEAPHSAVTVAALGAGRRLLSDDRHFLEAVSRLAARRVDSLRVTEERLERNLREQQIRRLATEAELRALRAQLHPHFLFNALTTIGHLIQTAPSRALETLLGLTQVLRGVLRRSTTEFSTLGEEIEFITAYLEIEHARFEERLRVSVDVPVEVRDCAIPALLLQPLVENAVRHGIGPERAGGTVRIAATTDGAQLRITVADSGRGFDPASVQAAAGLGLRNVAQRLEAHYGAKGRLRIESAVGRGTTIDLDLPLARVPQPARLALRKKAG